MATKTISLRIDEDLYHNFKQFCDAVYIPPSALFSAFAAKTVKEQKIPFEIERDPFYSESNMAILKESIRQLENGEGVVHELIED
jgi:DNA-damage-inducible protein J